MKKASFIKNLPRGIILTAYSLFIIIPFYMVIVTAFKPGNEIYSNPLGLPKKLVLENFKIAIERGNLLLYGINSIIVTVVSTILVVVLNLLCAYGIYKIEKMKIGFIIYSIIMSGLIIPQVGYVSTILTYQRFHVYNTLQGLIIRTLVGSLPISVFLFLGFFRSIPKEIEESALIDGCGDIQLLINIIGPLLGPATSTVALLNILASWNDLFGPVLLLKNPRFYTIPVGLLNFKNSYSANYELFFASIFIIGTPIVAVFYKFQDKFVESLTGSVKG